jgi:hypothetical protein
MQINFPLFVLLKDCGEIIRCNTVHEMQFRFEKIDIENEEYQAWDKDGCAVDMKLQEPVWIFLVPSAQGSDPDQLRLALLRYAASVGVQLPEQFPISAFETALDQIKIAHEKQLLANSPIRLFFARFRKSAPS